MRDYNNITKHISRNACCGIILRVYDTKIIYYYFAAVGGGGVGGALLYENRGPATRQERRTAAALWRSTRTGRKPKLASCTASANTAIPLLLLILCTNVYFHTHTHTHTRACKERHRQIKKKKKKKRQDISPRSVYKSPAIVFIKQPPSCSPPTRNLPSACTRLYRNRPCVVIISRNIV